MVVTCGGAGGSGFESGSGMGTKPIDDGLCEYIASEVTRDIIDATSMLFVSIKEGIIRLMEDLLRIFRADLAASQPGSRTLSIKDFKGHEAPEFFGTKDPITAI